MRRYPKKPKSTRNFVIACIIVVLLIVLSVIINISLRPIIFDMAEQTGKYAIYDVINDTVGDLFAENTVNYSELVKLAYNDFGCVTAVEYNYSQVNSIKLKCAEQLNTRLNKLKASRISVPLGSVFGDVSAQGRGPKLKFRLTQSAVPEINIVSYFESCGINQTKHEIRLIIDVDAQVYIPPNKSIFSCRQEYILASTVVVGDIPTGYAEIK